MALKALLFDMDGTLGDTMPVVVQALRETFRHYANRDYSTAEIAEMFGPSEEGVIRPRVPAAVYPQALQYYLDRYAELHYQAQEPFPGVYALLEALRHMGIHRGVVTGKGRGTAEISMRAMGLDSHIELLLTGSAAGAEKPAAIRRALAEWGVAPQEAGYVGDMPYDMQAAREAGVIPLGAAWADSATVSASTSDGAQVFDRVEELLRWVETYQNETAQGG